MVSLMPKDSLSALLDGECSGPELDSLLEAIDQSPELAEQWSRLCMAKEAQVGTRITATQPCICLDVMSKLDPVPAVAGAKVVDIAVHKANRKSALAMFWKPAVGFAAAASMGAAAVMLIQPQANTGSGDGAGPFVTAGTIADSGFNRRDPNLHTVSGDEDAHARMLREYLMDHSSAIADEGVGGTLRYARFAAHTAEYRPQSDEQP